MVELYRGGELIGLVFTNPADQTCLHQWTPTCMTSPMDCVFTEFGIGPPSPTDSVFTHSGVDFVYQRTVSSLTLGWTFFTIDCVITDSNRWTFFTMDCVFTDSRVDFLHNGLCLHRLWGGLSSPTDCVFTDSGMDFLHQRTVSSLTLWWTFFTMDCVFTDSVVDFLHQWTVSH